MLPSLSKSPVALLTAALAALPLSSAEYLLETKSLNPCQSNSSFSATLFNVAFTPSNNSLAFAINGVSSITGNVKAQLEVIAYGYPAVKLELDPCDDDSLKESLCPMNTGPIELNSNADVPASAVKQIPGIAYTIPDLDGKVKIVITSADNGEQLACVEADLSNGKSVYQKGVGWTTAIIAGLGLVASAITSGLGHSNTAAHVAANAMSLFGYFQAQAFIGMSSVSLPPIVASWTQNFQWSMGIIRIGFLQKMATWYQRATGGTPSTYLSDLSTTSVEVQKVKRGVMEMSRHAVRSMTRLAPRSNNAINNAETTQRAVLRGIERVGFRARIEPTNVFFTGYTFFVIFVILVVLGVVIFKFVCEGLVKAGKMKGDKFLEFRNGWRTVLKGILYRIVLIGFPQMIVLCFWQLTVRDSSAEVVLAVFTLITMIGILGWASSKVIRIAQHSVTMHKNPAYILYSDPASLNKWGFLYVQFKATAYYFIVPVLFYLMVKGMFIGLSQKSGVAQAIALVLIEAALLIAVSVLRPYMDKKTNIFNIAIAAMNFLSALFLLIFSEIFGQPGIVTGVVGVLFFLFNVIFALVLLIMVLVSSGFALFTKNPDSRYQPMRDDRGSFIKSQTQLTTELDALGATARGEPKGPYQRRSGIDDDDDSFSSGSNNLAHSKEAGYVNDQYAPPPSRSPADPSVPMFPGSTPSQPPPSYYGNSNPSSRGGDGYGNQQQYGQQNYRQVNNSSPWQRGAGYDH